MKILMQTARAQIEDIGDRTAALRFIGETDSATASWAADALSQLENDMDAFVITSADGFFGKGYDANEIKSLTQEGNWDGLDKLSACFQNLTETIRRLSKPVTAAVNGLAMDFGVELAMSCDAICEAEAEYGFGAGKNGFPLMGGGLSEIALNTYGISADVPGLDVVPLLKRVYQCLYMSPPCKGFTEAVKKGLPLKGTQICGEADLLEKSKREALHLFVQGYEPQTKDRVVMVTGSTGTAALEIMAINMRYGNFISEQLLETAAGIAWVLGGGDVPKNTLVPESRLLACEREAFVSACKRSTQRKGESA